MDLNAGEAIINLSFGSLMIGMWSLPLKASHREHFDTHFRTNSFPPELCYVRSPMFDIFDYVRWWHVRV